MHWVRKSLSFVFILAIFALVPWCGESVYGASVVREVPDRIQAGEPFEVVLKIEGESPLALGVIETLPPGCRIQEAPGAGVHHRIDDSGNRMALAVFQPGEVRYRVTASTLPEEPFHGAFVDLLVLNENKDEGRERFQAILPEKQAPASILPGPGAMKNRGKESLPGDDGDNRLTEQETADLVCGYLLGSVPARLDDVCDAAYIYRVWGGQPKTVTDMNNRALTFYRPVERIITTNPDNSRTIIALGLGNLIVATDECTIGSCICARAGNRKQHAEVAPNCWSGVCGGELAEIPQTSTRKTVNYELMATLNPDVIFETTFWSTRADNLGQKVGAPVVVAGCDFDMQTWFDQIEVIGRVLDREKEARALVAFCRAKIDRVAAVTRTIPDDEKPRVYFAPRGAGKGFYDPKEGRDFTRTYQVYDPLDLAGGINVAAAVTGEEVNVSVEQIIAWNPEFILVACSAPEDRGVDFLIEAKELGSIEAIRKSQVYNVMYPHCRGRPVPRNIVNLMLFAKLLHPDRFQDLDLEKEANEIYRAFLGIENGFTEYAEYLQFPLAYFEGPARN